MTAFTLVFGYRKLILAVAAFAMAAIFAGMMLGGDAVEGSWQALWGDRLGLAGFAGIGVIFVLYAVPGLAFLLLQGSVVPIGSLRRILRPEDRATSRLRSAAQGWVELQLDPVEQEVRHAFNLELPDYVGLFSRDDDLVFILFADVEGLPARPTGAQFVGPVIASGSLLTIPVGPAPDLRDRPFGLSLRLARKLFSDRKPDLQLAAIQAALARVMQGAEAHGFRQINLLTGDPATGEASALFSGGERQARQALRGIGMAKLALALILALILWFGFLRHYV